MNHLISLYDGTKIVSCSSDSTIRIWGTAQKINFRKKRDTTEFVNNGTQQINTKPRAASKKTKMYEPIKLGEMYCHTDQVNQLLSLTENAFASCSNDNSIILWKDGRIENDYRNRFSANLIKQISQLENQHLLKVQQQQLQHEQQQDKPPTTEYKVDHQSETDNSFQSATQERQDPNQLLSNVPITPTDLESDSITSIPDEVFEYANRLKLDKKVIDFVDLEKHNFNLCVSLQLSVDAISENLRQQGHSEETIRGIAMKLRLSNF